MPALVVAPISVNRFKDMRMLLAIGPVPLTRSREKSSIAGYNTSSILRLRRCISSINSTSPFSRLVSKDARSAAFSIAGPLVTLICAPNSLAITCASVVFPSPGRAVKQHVVESVVPRLCGRYEHFKILLDFLLPDVLVRCCADEGCFLARRHRW